MVRRLHFQDADQRFQEVVTVQVTAKKLLARPGAPRSVAERQGGGAGGLRPPARQGRLEAVQKVLPDM